MKTTLGNFKVEFLIVTALKEERDAILQQLHDYKVVPIEDKLICYLGHLDPQSADNEKQVAITTLSQMGNVESGIHAAKIIHALNPRFVLMVGIAAGIENEVRLGDLVVSQQIIYYELGKLTANEQQFRPESIPADLGLYQYAMAYSEGDWQTLILKDKPQSSSEEDKLSLSSVKFGPFAVGDKVVADESQLNKLLRLHPKIISIEMESYGTARATLFAPNHPGFLAIRGISDFADSKKNDQWREYACAVAAAFTIGFIRFTFNMETAFLPKLDESANVIVISHQSLQAISRQTLADTLVAESNTGQVREITILQSDLFKDGRLIDPLEAARRQTDVSRQIDQLISSDPSACIKYFGVAHIPLLFLLGYQITNKRKLSFYEYDRYKGIWNTLGKESAWPELLANGIPNRRITKIGDVVLRISVSNTIELSDVNLIVANPIASAHLYLQQPTRDVMVNEKQLWEYGDLFRKTLDRIHEKLPNRLVTHIFYAGPVSLAVYLGQLISHTFDGRVIVHNFSIKDMPRYSWGFEITNPVGYENFYTSTN